MTISRDPRQRPWLVVMVKEPRPGRVKTRLGKGIGMVPAAQWFRRQSLSLLDRVQDPRWDIVLAVSPDREGLTSRVWPQHLPRVPQGRGDLGTRMSRLLRLSQTRPICVVGADIPDLDTHHVARAFAALNTADIVFGPATDGGYWLIGRRRGLRLPPTALKGVRWSTEHALQDSLRTLAKLRCAQTTLLQDVDTAEDLAGRP